MKCDAKTFFGVINAFRSLNLFSLLPLSRQEYMVMFVIAGQRKTNPEGSTVSMVTQKMHVPQPAVARCVGWKTTVISAAKYAALTGGIPM